jgi:hypothetical protein
LTYARVFPSTHLFVRREEEEEEEEESPLQ